MDPNNRKSHESFDSFIDSFVNFLKIDESGTDKHHGSIISPSSPNTDLRLAGDRAMTKPCFLSCELIFTFCLDLAVRRVIGQFAKIPCV